MMDKKVTRKEFLLSILSITAIFALSKIPKEVTQKLSSAKLNTNNTYGNHVYGSKKNI